MSSKWTLLSHTLHSLASATFHKFLQPPMNLKKSILAVVQGTDIPILEALILLLAHVHLRGPHVLRKHRMHDY